MKPEDRVDPRTPIPPTDVTFGWVFDALAGRDARWDHLRKHRALDAVQVEVVSGSGFLAYVLRLRVLFREESEPFSVILKVPISARLAELCVDPAAHTGECGRRKRAHDLIA